MSKQLQFTQAQQLTDRAALDRDEITNRNLTGASYAIGRVLGDVWDHPHMDFRELQVASAICFSALAEGNSGVTVAEISNGDRRHLRNNQVAMQRLAEAGFVRALRPAQTDLDRGETEARWVFQSPFDLVLAK